MKGRSSTGNKNRLRLLPERVFGKSSYQCNWLPPLDHTKIGFCPDAKDSLIKCSNGQEIQEKPKQDRKWARIDGGKWRYTFGY